MRRAASLAVLSLLAGCYLSGSAEEDGTGPWPYDPAPGDCRTGHEGEDDPYWCCDPDDLCGCDCEAYWRCTTDESGDTSCVQKPPPLPDDGGDGRWDCAYLGQVISCTGRADEHPLAGGADGFACYRSDDLVLCERELEADDVPDDVGEWDCAYEPDASARTCDEVDERWRCAWNAPTGALECRDGHPGDPIPVEWTCLDDTDGDVCCSAEFPDDGSEPPGGGSCHGGGDWVCCWNEWECTLDDGVLSCWPRSEE